MILLIKELIYNGIQVKQNHCGFIFKARILNCILIIKLDVYVIIINNSYMNNDGINQKSSMKIIINWWNIQKL